MFLTTIIIYVVLRKLTNPVVTEDVEETGTSSLSAPTEPTEDEGYTSEQYAILKRTGKFAHRLHLVIWNLIRFFS